MVIENYIQAVVDNGLKVSVEKMGETSYPYAMGYFESNMVSILKDLNLSNKQLKVLQANLNRMSGE